jgi:hypothetical protein
MEASMRAISPVAAAIVWLLGGASTASAGSDQLAATGGFLLGNAHRCGVSPARVARAANVIHDMIVAAADDDAVEITDAEERYVEVFLASAFPDTEQNALVPSCGVVIAQFNRLERYHRQAGLN